MPVRRSYRLLYHSFGPVDHLGKGLGPKARTAHQAAVHVLLRQDLAYVPRLDRTAIEYTDLPGKIFSDKLPQENTHTPNSLLRIRWGGHIPGPDSPDGLVSEDEIVTCDSVRVEEVEDRPDLLRDLIPHPAGVTFLLGLADTDDREELGGDGPGSFSGDHFVGLAKERAPLRVPDYYRPGPNILEHRRRDLPRVRARVLVVEVLGPGYNRRVLYHPGNRAETGKRRKDGDIYLVGVRDLGQQPCHVVLRLPHELVHLPVRRHQRPAYPPLIHSKGSPSQAAQPLLATPCPPRTLEKPRHPSR